MLAALRLNQAHAVLLQVVYVCEHSDGGSLLEPQGPCPLDPDLLMPPWNFWQQPSCNHTRQRDSHSVRFTMLLQPLLNPKVML